MSAGADPSPPTIEQATRAFFQDFDFGEGSSRTQLSYRSGARAFLRFLEEHPDLTPQTPINQLPSSIAAEFNAWMLTAVHTGPGLVGPDGPTSTEEGYSLSTRRLYSQALTRLLRFWWYRSWLSFSPEQEDRARKALQLQVSGKKRARVQSRSPHVPTDFGDRMLEAADSLPLPTARDIPDPSDRRRLRLETLRARALVAALRATALRVGDICALDRMTVDAARDTGGYLRVQVAKTEHAAHVVLGDRALAAIDEYLAERDDSSPWIFIQHGSSGSPPRGRRLSPEAYRRRTRGYGARASPGLVRKVVVELAERAGYDPGKDQFVSTHAFRHWHAQRMVEQGASIDDVQSVLGHARSETTREVYAPEPNVPRIISAEKEIQA